MVDKTQIRQYTLKPKTVIIVYDQPKVTVVRRYTRTVIRRVNPDEYRQKFDHVLLDTATLLEIAKRLNIQESMVNNHIINFFSSPLDFSSLHHRKCNKLNQDRRE